MPNNARRLFPVRAEWATLRRNFRWPRPTHFNIADACCDSWSRTTPDRIALTDLAATRRDWTYGALCDASNRLANAFAARGLRQGDRVAVLLPQCAEVLIVQFAAMKLGAVALPLFTLFGPEALAYRLADSGASLAVTDADNLEKLLALQPGLPDLHSVYCTTQAPAPARSLWQDIAAASPDLVPVATRAEDPAVMIYTSGTTGPPKGVLHAHRFLIGHLPSMELTHEGFPQPGDKGWTPADWAWIGGLMDLALPCLYYGVPLVAHRMRKFDPEAAYGMIAREQIRTLFMPPTALKLMRGVSVPAEVRLRSVSSGGESLGAEILDWGRSALGAPINELYGQTECNLVLTQAEGFMPVKPGSMGQALPGFDVTIRTEQGEAPTGALGEICVRKGAASMFLRYWNQPVKTAEKFLRGTITADVGTGTPGDGDWLRTGDLGRRDCDGYFTFVAREDDVITSAGYRIGPSEIENCLQGDPDVQMAACIGVPDALRTEVVQAYVVLREGAARDGLAARLIQRVRDRVSPHVAPRTVIFVDTLPMTATGKVMRKDLRPKS